MEEGAKPVIQPLRRIPIHYRELLKEHLKEMLEQDVIEGPLQEEEAGTWISNLMITGKKWDAGDKDNEERRYIRANPDYRPLNEVVYQTHEPIPTVEELRYKLGGSQSFSKLDMLHCFHQFEIEEKARKLFMFRTPDGLYRYKRLVMGNSPASSECHRRVRDMVEGCEGVLQIKDDILVYGREEEHNQRLKKVLERIEESGCTLRRDKCEFGKSQVTWFGFTFLEEGMASDLEKSTVIKEWPATKTVKEVKSLLQTLQFNRVYIGAEKPGEMNYPDLTHPLRELTKMKAKFKWMETLEKHFKIIKDRLCSDLVI